MTSTSIPNLSGPSATSGNSIMGTSSASFGANPFLQLLTAQLQNQTPLQPVDDNSFMQQMASYSSMTQQQDLNSNLLKLLNYQGILARMQGLSEGSALLGKQVTYNTDTQQGLSGTVSSIYINDQGDVQLRLDDGTEIGMNQVTGISGAEQPGASGPSGSGSTPSGPGQTGQPTQPPSQLQPHQAPTN
jgi:flagellar basal-body rod modification protein FlgD